MLRLILACFVMSAALLASVRQESVDASVARARALFGEGKLEESLELLLSIDQALRSQPDRLDQATEVKLQLTLIHIEMGQSADARVRIAEFYLLDPDFVMDPQRFPPNVISLFEEVRSQNKVTCSKLCRDADDLLESGEAEKLLLLVQIQGPRCLCLEALAKDAAEYFYQRGVQAQKNGDLAGAMKELQFAIRFDPAHMLAPSAIEGVDGQFKAAAETAFLQWRSDLAAGQFGLAAGIYRQMTTTKTDNAPQILEQMRAGYRQQMSPAIQLWNTACSRDDKVLMDRAHRLAVEVMPDPEFGEDLIDSWMVCAKKP